MSYVEIKKSVLAKFDFENTNTILNYNNSTIL